MNLKTTAAMSTASLEEYVRAFSNPENEIEALILSGAKHELDDRRIGTRRELCEKVREADTEIEKLEGETCEHSDAVKSIDRKLKTMRRPVAV